MSSLDINAIRDYLLEAGCKIEYPILVNAFKKHLYNTDPEIQKDVRNRFKDYVNRLATVCLEDNMKFIILRPEFREDKQSPPMGSKTQPVRAVPARSQTFSNPPAPVNNDSNHYPHPPKIPPRRKSSLAMSNRPNIMTPIQQTPVMPPPIPPHFRQSSLDDSSSLQAMDPLRRRWTLEAANCNYRGLVDLLRDDPKLAGYKDIVNRYTALHWAAKFGNLDIIDLLAGTYGVSVNIRSSAGYTPLHIAYMHKKIDVADLLIKSYGANPNIRDYAGKRPTQYCH